MPAYRRIRDIDSMWTVLTPSRQVDICSGTLGWRGADGSGSVSVYAGARGIGGSQVIRSTSGSAYPLTASISYVELKLSDSLAENSYRWNNRHWDVVDGLYRYHSRYNASYSTGTYDYQCIFFRDQWPNIITLGDDLFTHSRLNNAMCVEAWVMPFTTSSQHHNGHTISSCRFLYWVGLTGSDSRLAFSSSLGFHTSSLPLTPGRWNHVAVSFGNGTGSLYVNLTHGKTFNYSQTGSMELATASYVPAVTIGNVFAGPLTSLIGQLWEDPSGILGQVSSSDTSGSHDRSFFGLMHEYRHWTSSRTWDQLSSSYNKRISIAATPMLYMPMTEGHRSGAFDPTHFSTYGVHRPVDGSGAMNFKRFEDEPSSFPVSFTLKKFYDAPSWLPNNNPNFIIQPTVMREGSSYTRSTMRVLNIPKVFYGRQIATGSFEMVCRSFSGVGLVRVVRDDGRGGLYIESYASSSLDDDMEAARWNRVGNIFYSEGVVTITDDSLLDLGADLTASTANAPEMLSVSFRGVSRVPVRFTSCRLAGGEANASLNPTFYTTASGSRERISEDTYITSVVLYDRRRNPVAVARLATPLRKAPGDRVNIRIRKDF